MIAVIGSAKERIKIAMKPPAESSDHAEPGSFAPADYAEMEIKENDKMIAESGGCGANIAANLAALGHETEFITAVGDDSLGAALRDRLERAGVNTDMVRTFPGMTAVNVDFMNVLGDLEFTRRNSVIIDNITPVMLKEMKERLEKAEAVIIDGSIPAESVRYLAEEYGSRNDIRLFYDPASVSGGYKVRDMIGRFSCVMPGRMEAEAMTRKAVLSQDQLMEAGAFFEERGVERIIITLKGGGLYYKEGKNEGVLRPERVLSFGSTSGAGDVVSAAVAAATVEGKGIEETAKYAMEKAAEYLADTEDEKFM